MIKRWRYKIALFVLLILSSSAPVLAQVPCSGDPDDPGYDPNGCIVPLDNWVIALIVVALFFGYKQLQKQKGPSF